MPETKRPLKVFLCHASLDKQKVRELYRYLRRRGIKPWFDEIDLVGGQDWQIEIPKALATSDAIIICLTKNSVDKEGYIQKEIKFALDRALEMPEGRIFLIPVRFEECEVPSSLSRYQWVDLFDEAGYARMMRALKFRASQLERATVKLPKKEIEEEKLALEKAAREKEEREAAEKDAREKAEQAERENLERESAEKARREKVERDVAERDAREKAKRETVEKSKRERTESLTAKIAVLKEALSNYFNSLRLVFPKTVPFIRIAGSIGIILVFFWAGSWAMSQLLTVVPTAKVSVTPHPIMTLTSNFPITFTKTVEPTAILTKTRTLTPTIPAAVSSTLPTALPVGPRPATYTMQNNEFTHCIARRFNVDPDELLALNGLFDSQTVYPGLVLKIPQSGKEFPGNRVLKTHPATYTVASANETIYGVACEFGDIDPSAIAQANGLSVGAALTSGQQLSIP